MAKLDVPTPSADELAKKWKLPLSYVTRQIKRGAAVEHEHSKEEKTAEEIARDHLGEDPHYYTKLKKAKLEEQTKKPAKLSKPVSKAQPTAKPATVEAPKTTLPNSAVMRKAFDAIDRAFPPNSIVRRTSTLKETSKAKAKNYLEKAEKEHKDISDKIINSRNLPRRVLRTLFRKKSNRESGMERAREIKETITSKTPVSSVIHDIVHSKNVRFQKDNKKKRIKRALAIYYSKHRGK